MGQALSGFASSRLEILESTNVHTWLGFGFGFGFGLGLGLEILESTNVHT